MRRSSRTSSAAWSWQGASRQETHHIRGTLAFTSLDYVATLWTRRKFEPNREHALEVLADNWYHLLCDEG